MVSPQQFTIPGPSGTATVDVNLRIRGNVIFNGDLGTPLGLGEESGCQPSNAACNASQILADNVINRFEPQLMNPAAGDFRPAPSSNLRSAPTFSIPDFSWSDAPARPAAPAGQLVNTVSTDRAGNPRLPLSTAGAYSIPSEPPATARRRSALH